MKQLIFVRHAKSDWTNDVPDFDRRLNERGHKDARKMAKFLIEQGIAIDDFISSPAKRAITTARYFAETYNHPKIKKNEHLYEPHFEDFENTILKLDDELKSVALFSHNPTISDYVSKLCGESVEFPTCAIAIVEINTDQWSLLETSEKKLIHFYTPKGFDS